MFRKALVATDLSPASDRVVAHVASLWGLGCRGIVLAHVIYVKHTVGLSEVLREEAAPKLAEQQAALEAVGFGVTTEVPVGVPGPTVLSLAHEHACSLIVVGSHGHSMAREVALGGVATDVMHRTDLPLLVVRMELVEDAGEVSARVSEGDIRDHVLYATDFSDTAERAFQYVEAVARSGCGRVTLIHVQESSRIGPHLADRLDEFNAIDRGRLERLKTRLAELGVARVDIEIPYGKPAQEILEAIRREHPTVVILGTHGRGYIAEVFIGSVSHNVVRQSPAPVLLIPPIR